MARQFARKSPLIAVLLQCLPLLFAGSCIASTFGPLSWYADAPGSAITFLLGLTLFAWGAGYLYLRQPRRALLALVGAVVLAILVWWLNLGLTLSCIDLGKSLNCPQRAQVFDRPFAVITAVVVGFWVAVYARDAFRLASSMNQGESRVSAGSESLMVRITLVSVAIGLAVLGFYLSPACDRLWQATR